MGWVVAALQVALCPTQMSYKCRDCRVGFSGVNLNLVGATLPLPTHPESSLPDAEQLCRAGQDAETFPAPWWGKQQLPNTVPVPAAWVLLGDDGCRAKPGGTQSRRRTKYGQALNSTCPHHLRAWIYASRGHLW